MSHQNDGNAAGVQQSVDQMRDELLLSSPQKRRRSYRSQSSKMRCKPVELHSKTRLKLKILKLHVTGAWKWTEGGEDTCGICRMEFEAACTNCKFPGDDCPLVLGVCRHAFHRHCIEKWASAAANNTPKAHCPLCRQDWELMASNGGQRVTAPPTDGGEEEDDDE